ncbi:MAG: hypothetical protein JW904_08905 [Spirochaetales bacterium]|nr:hypothetical protein [Spirochaetales bacterium]
MKIFLIALLAFCLCTAAVFAQELSENRDPLLLNFGLRLLGADVGLGYIISDPNSGSPDTILWGIVGGGYEWVTFFRDLNDEQYDGTFPGYEPAIDPYYDRINARFDLGIAQGIVFNNRLKRNLLEAFLFYKIRYDFPIENTDLNQLFFDSTLEETSGLFQNSLLFGFSFNDLDARDPHGTKTGIYAEVSGEWGPEFLMNNLVGRADFIRVNFSSKGFLKLFDIAPEEKLNLLSGYFGAFLALDYCAGNVLPANIQQTLGGRSPRWGLGNAVRGYEDARFDGQFKAVLNLEFRLNIMQFDLFGLGANTPGIIVFFDSGYYDFMYYQDSGFLFSAGAGVFINLIGYTSLTFYTAFPLSKTLVTGDSWMPFVIGFDAHF